MRKLFCTTALIGVLSWGTAQATADTPSSAQLPKKSLEQAREDARQKSIDTIKNKFVEMDANKDGTVTKEEFVKFRIDDYIKKQEDIYNKIDTENKGGFTESEYVGATEKMMNDISNKIANMMKQAQEKKKNNPQ